MSVEHFHKWGHKKVNGWRYYEHGRYYPPTSPPFPREVVRKSILALGKFELDYVDPAPWMVEQSLEEVKATKKKVKPAVLNYVRALQTFKAPDSSFGEAAQKATNVYNEAVTEIYENDLESFVTLVIEAERTAIINGLSRSNIHDSWRKYYRHPENLKELPEAVQNVITSGMRYLIWESVAPSYDRFGPYQNPFGPEYEIYNSGASKIGFTTDSRGREAFEYDVRMNPDTGFDFANIVVPVATVEAEIARRKLMRAV